MQYTLSPSPLKRSTSKGCQIDLCWTPVEYQSSSVPSPSRIWLFVTPWTPAHEASLSITNSWSLLKFLSIESVWCHPTISSFVVSSSCLQSFPASGSFPMSQFFTSGDQSIGVSTSTSVLSMNIQDWFPLGLTGWISLMSKGLSRVFFMSMYDKNHYNIVK